MHNIQRLAQGLQSFSPPPNSGTLVAQLGPTHRSLVTAHLCGLPPGDRRLRFGHAASDRSIADYVRRIRFFRDTAWGAFDPAGHLLGFGHLACSEDHAEFALSIDPAARRRGIGLALLDRAAANARNRGCQVLVMHFRPGNEALAALARQRGMQIVCDSSEGRAYLGLKPPTPHSLLREAWLDAIAALDLGFRRSAGATSA